MTVVTTDLAGFLLARVAEDEASAQRQQVPIPPDRDPVTGEWKTVPGAHKPGDRRLLAECEAKRRIIQWHSADHEGYCLICLENSELDQDLWVQEKTPCTTLRFLTLPYADHPDYREEWKP